MCWIRWGAPQPMRSAIQRWASMFTLFHEVRFDTRHITVQYLGPALGLGFFCGSPSTRCCYSNCAAQKELSSIQKQASASKEGATWTFPTTAVCPQPREKYTRLRRYQKNIARRYPTFEPLTSERYQKRIRRISSNAQLDM
jgi:hypothetical protein